MGKKYILFGLNGYIGISEEPRNHKSRKSMPLNRLGLVRVQQGRIQTNSSHEGSLLLFGHEP